MLTIVKNGLKLETGIICPVDRTVKPAIFDINEEYFVFDCDIKCGCHVNCTAYLSHVYVHWKDEYAVGEPEIILNARESSVIKGLNRETFKLDKEKPEEVKFMFGEDELKIKIECSTNDLKDSVLILRDGRIFAQCCYSSCYKACRFPLAHIFTPQDKNGKIRVVMDARCSSVVFD